MIEAQWQAEQLLTQEHLQTQDTQVAMNKEAIERRQMLVSNFLSQLKHYNYCKFLCVLCGIVYSSVCVLCVCVCVCVCECV